MSQELTSPLRLATMVFTAMLSYCISLRPTGSMYLDAAGSLAYTPAHQHVELHAAASAQPGEPGDVECLEERDHGHRRIHPHFKRICPGRLFRVYFSHV